MELTGIRFEVGEVRQTPIHIHEDIEVFLLLRGSVEVELDGKLYTMRDGDIVLSNPRQMHAIRSSVPNILFRIIIGNEFFAAETGQTELRMQCNSCKEHTADKLQEYARLRRSIYRLLRLHYAEEPSNAFEMKSAVYQMLSILTEQFRDPDSPSEYSGYSARIAEVVRRIQNNYKEDLSLQMLAEETGSSVHGLSRQFRKETGEKFIDYLGRTRLAGAVNDLLNTKDSVLKLAMNNGFPNVASFNRLFYQVYETTPAKYRMQRERTSAQHDPAEEAFRPLELSVDFIRHLHQFEDRHNLSVDEELNYQLDLSGRRTSGQIEKKHILRVGSMGQLLKATVREEIDELADEIKLDYVHFAAVFYDDMAEYTIEMHRQFDLSRAMNVLADRNIAALIQLWIPGDAAEVGALERDCEKLEYFLRFLTDCYPRYYLERIRFEITFIDDCPETCVQRYTKKFSRLIHKWISKSKIGLQFHYYGRSFDSQIEKFCRILSVCKENHVLPAFYTFYFEIVEQKLDMEEEEYHRFRHIGGNLVERFADALAARHLDCSEVLLMQWNTLSGYTRAESNAFFRAALFLDEIVNLPDYVNGVGVWLNASVHDATSINTHFDVVSLYLLGSIKRPAYFTMQLLSKLYPNVLMQEPHVIVTTDDKDNLAVLFINASYFNPMQAMEESVTALERRVITLKLEGIHGEYEIARYHIDNKRTSPYDHWARIGFPPVTNPKTIKHLVECVYMEYTMYREELSGRCAISETLNFNETTLLLVRKKEHAI